MEQQVRLCGCEISAQEVRLAVVQLTDEGKIEMLRLKTTRIELGDDTSEADLRSFQAALHEFSREHEIDTFAIKTRAKKGKMAGGAVSFKIETPSNWWKGVAPDSLVPSHSQILRRKNLRPILRSYSYT